MHLLRACPAPVAPAVLAQVPAPAVLAALALVALAVLAPDRVNVLRVLAVPVAVLAPVVVDALLAPARTRA